MPTSINFSISKLIAIGFILLIGILIYFSNKTLKKIKFIQQYDISELKYNLKPNYPTVDLIIIHSNQVEATWEDLKEEFKEARKIYESYGVQLNLVKAIEVSYPEKWNGMAIEEIERKPEGQLDFYEKIEFVKINLPQEAEKIFHSFVDQAMYGGRPVYVITLSDLIVSWYEKNDKEEWTLISSTTSAVSFPSYVFAERIPRRFRGLISFQRTKPNKKTLAHELGHKLINVSHEGLSHCPQGDGETIPGLMGYGDSKEIFGGKKGRWHLERLMLSPYIYRLVGGKKIWNKDYEGGGVYNDPIYGSYIVDPACPQ